MRNYIAILILLIAAVAGVSAFAGTEGKIAECAWGASTCTGGGGAAGGMSSDTQESPSVLESLNDPGITISNPAAALMGFGATLKVPNSNANPDGEPDNILGFFYNKDGPGESTGVNQYEHAFHCPRVETAFRTTVATSDQTYVEFNCDLWPPDNETVVDNASGGWDPLAGEYMSLAGGGTIRVLDWTVGTSTLEYRQDFGVTVPGETATQYIYTETLTGAGFNSTLPAQGDIITFTGGTDGSGVIDSYDNGTAVLVWRRRSDVVPTGGETVTIVARGLSGTLPAGPITAATQTADIHDTTVTYLGSSAGHTFRHYQCEWNTLSNSVGCSYRTSPDDTNGVFRFNGDGIGLNWQDSISSGVQASNTPGEFSGSAFTWRSTSEGTDEPSALFTTPINSQFIMDWTGTNYSFSTPYAIRINSPLGPAGTGTTFEASSPPAGIRIEDQGGWVDNHDAMQIAAQTCNAGDGASACTAGDTGNLTFKGGDWNNGHIVMTGQGTVGGHLWHDNASKVWRTRRADPTSATNGYSFVTGSNSATHGPAIWAISNGGTLDTGDEICQYAGADFSAPGVGMTCQDTLEVGTSGGNYGMAQHSDNTTTLVLSGTLSQLPFDLAEIASSDLQGSFSAQASTGIGGAGEDVYCYDGTASANVRIEANISFAMTTGVSGTDNVTLQLAVDTVDAITVADVIGVPFLRQVSSAAAGMGTLTAFTTLATNDCIALLAADQDLATMSTEALVITVEEVPSGGLVDIDCSTTVANGVKFLAMCK